MAIETEREIRASSNDEELVRLRRQTIREAALQVFLEKGYERTSMRDIGRACGMSHGNLYNYVSSKTDILHLLFVHQVMGAGPLRSLRSTLGDASYTKVLSECMVRSFQNCDSTREYLLLFNREIHRFSREDRHRLLASEADDVSFFEQLLREGTEAGEFQVSKPIIIAHDILMYGFDWAVRQWFLKQHCTLEEYTEEHIRMVLELVGAKTSRTASTQQAESEARVSSNTSQGA